MMEDHWQRMDRAERTIAYDNRRAVADSNEYPARWQRLSEDVRRDFPADLDVRYGPRPRNLVDIFPARRADAPMVVHIHGGYWQRNSKDDFAWLARPLLREGLAFAAIGYTLAPEAGLTAIVDEIHRALDALRDRAASASLRRRTILTGWSAGGHLAALASSRPDIDATLAISGIFDLEPVRGIEQDDALGLTQDEVDRLSPIRHVADLHAPIVVAHGAMELSEFQRQSRDYCTACRAAGLDATLSLIGQKNHFSILDSFIEPDGALARIVLELAARSGAS